MRVLVTGAYGFIGSHIAIGLAQRGHSVVACGRDVAFGKRLLPAFEWLACDFNRDVDVASWLPRLKGIDAVINCVGILQSSMRDSAITVHERAPRALFAACQQASVPRVVHISAPGVDAADPTGYSRTKAAIETHLASMDLNAIIVRPSLVVARGSYGGTSLIRGLAGLPGVIPLPEGGRQLFWPLTIDDLVEAVCRLAADPDVAKRVLDLGGPQELSLREIVGAYRRWLGFDEGRVITVPRWAMRLLALAGDVSNWFGGRTALTTTSVLQLQKASVASAAAARHAIGREPTALSDFLAASPSAVQDRWHARLYFLRPVLRLILGAFWFVSGLIALLPAGADKAAGILRSAGLGAEAPLLVAVGGVVDVLLGLPLILGLWVRTVGALQLVVAAFYLIAATVLTGPALWLDPLGPLVKLLPIMVATAVMIAIEPER